MLLNERVIWAPGLENWWQVSMEILKMADDREIKIKPVKYHHTNIEMPKMKAVVHAVYLGVHVTIRNFMCFWRESSKLVQ